VGYTGRKDPAVLHAHLLAAPSGATGPAGAAAASLTQAFVAALIAIVAQIHALEARIAAQLGEHTDAHIFLSLPRAQALRAARLLAEIGDCRARFPTPESLASLAGVTPSARQSGKMKITAFRWSADKQLRDAVCDFAADSRHDNPWAADLYDQAITRGHRHPHAVRILARAWIYVIWRCWQDHKPYDPARHRALQALLDEQASAAA
jgi:transposase